jgi:hypothetical protein
MIDVGVTDVQVVRVPEILIGHEQACILAFMPPVHLRVGAGASAEGEEKSFGVPVGDRRISLFRQSGYRKCARRQSVADRIDLSRDCPIVFLYRRVLAAHRATI